jgi:hypothetical protein
MRLRIFDGKSQEAGNMGLARQASCRGPQARPPVFWTGTCEPGS